LATSFGANFGGFHKYEVAASVSDISKSDIQNFQMDVGVNDTGLAGKSNNETKMSDNEVFMAYMNKAGGDEEDDE
jgi:hypothetical protein